MAARPLIPAVAVPVSLIGTFAVMYLLGYSLDNLSLMALTISTGFVVDDAIVVMENITRHLEDGMTPMGATLQGAKEIGFTVLSISISLIAVFIPLLLMGGIVGRLFREFAITLSTAIIVSMVISLTTTPTMCAYLLKDQSQREHGRFYLITERFFDWVLSIYRRSLHWVLDNTVLTLTVLALTIALNVIVIIKIPKGVLSAAGHGSVGRRYSRPAGCLFSCDERLVAADRQGDSRRSRSQTHHCVHRRWRCHEYRWYVHLAQAIERSSRQDRARWTSLTGSGQN